MARQAPLLGQAAAVIGDVQVRNVGTIGGSLAHADPAADYPAAVLAAEAQIVARGPGGERVIDAGDFFVDLFLTSLQADEIITEIRVPAAAAGSGACYLKFPHPASRFAVVGCAAVVDASGGACSDVRVAFTGVANAAFRDGAVEAALSGRGRPARMPSRRQRRWRRGMRRCSMTRLPAPSTAVTWRPCTPPRR